MNRRMAVEMVLASLLSPNAAWLLCPDPFAGITLTDADAISLAEKLQERLAVLVRFAAGKDQRWFEALESDLEAGRGPGEWVKMMIQKFSSAVLQVVILQSILNSSAMWAVSTPVRTRCADLVAGRSCNPRIRKWLGTIHAAA